MKDIENEEDIALLVDSFYKRVSADETLSGFFAHTNWAHHLPRMRAFWEFVLLDKPGDIKGMFDTHAQLNIKPLHFTIWLKHFNATLDTHFAGSNVEKAKQRALVIAYTFNSKINPDEELDLG